MTDDTTTECVLFPELFTKPAVLKFDQRQGSSDGGAVLLKAAERRYELIAGLAGCLEDKRQAGKVDHWLNELLAQRVFSIVRLPARECCVATRATGCYGVWFWA